MVDDDKDTCEILGVVLKKAGAEVRTCLSASQALTAMDSWVPDILVSDIAMPGEDGYTLIRKVRARKTEDGGGVPAVGGRAAAHVDGDIEHGPARDADELAELAGEHGEILATAVLVAPG